MSLKSSYSHLGDQRKGLTWAGTFPAAIAFTALVKAPRALFASAAEVFFKTDLKCLGRMPEGPAPEPFGKERASVSTSAGVYLARPHDTRACTAREYCPSCAFVLHRLAFLSSKLGSSFSPPPFFFFPLVAFISCPAFASAHSCPHSPACQRLSLSLMSLT